MYGDSRTSNILSQILGRGQRIDPSLQGLLPPQQQSSNLIGDLFNNMAQSGQTLAQKLANGTYQAEQTAVDPREALLQSLFNQADTSSPNTADYEQALQNSANQIKAAFGAQIGAVKASNNAARKQNKRGQHQIKAMYKALNKEYVKSAQGQTAQGQADANALQQIAATAQGQVKQNSDQILNEQAALAKSLGVESASPNIIAKQQGKVADVVQNMAGTGQREANLALQNSASQQEFLQRGGKTALLEGTNKRADLIQQLQDFVQANLGKIADIKGQRGMALASNAQKFAAAGAQNQSDARQQTFDNKYKLLDMLNSIAAQKEKSSQGAAQDSAMPKALQWYNELVNSSSDPTGIGQLLTKVTSGPDFASGQVDLGHGTTTRMTATQAGNEAIAEAMKQGITDPQDLIKIRAAAQAYWSQYGG